MDVTTVNNVSTVFQKFYIHFDIISIFLIIDTKILILVHFIEMDRENYVFKSVHYI